MQKPEFRVRPVIRHVVTRYTTSEPLPSGPNGEERRTTASLETLGEFGNEDYAEIVREALAERVAPREFILVQNRPGEVDAKVHYAYSEAEVSAFLGGIPESEPGWRVFSRIRQQQPPV